MHPHRPSFARPSVSREPIVDGDLNARAALITPAPRYDKPHPCIDFTAGLSRCEYSPDFFIDLTPQEKAWLASCLCSDGRYSYKFDAHVSSCLKVLHSPGPRRAHVSQWSDFCYDNHIPSPTTTQYRPARWSTPAPSTVANLAACSTMCSVLTSCANKSPGFMDMDSATQASCLCYTSTKWVPDVWDSAFASCATEAAAASCMSIASVPSEFEGLCHSVGSVTPVGNPSVTPTPTPTPPPTHAPNHAGEIAGGVLGGIAGIGVICGAIFFRKWMAK
ncbi:hypothetical protein CNMCM5793_006898 [Aspergillus hiratsukae]|uniref:Uncharacterized protein n=1 Tax=Aspergillus hiratsukae TaxID=1194566 RepID=A0A8H6V0Y3_9EURO|nr:hypothetical protein CNMCM5793_006898 [Aspergillus hiratsukae]KAF7173967.1 hypothetical protein CNMCM6106_008070 [Aspergillus hiratsukae]